MAVEDILTRVTEDLVLPPQAFYPLKIPVIHYQLRHFISSAEPNLIYYASGQTVYCLDVETNRRVHVASLPFDARCATSAYGWVCVGGAEDGHFAAIKLDGGLANDGTEVDSLLPLGFGSGTHSSPSIGSSRPSAHFEKMGEEIVNSISIHKYPGDEVVAVLTNNDKTVRIYSLTRLVETAVLALPFPMNHATISPDGQLLVAVGDYQQACFFRSTKSSTTPPQSSKPSQSTDAPSAVVEWTEFAKAKLHCPPTPNSSTPNQTGYFTTAWSPSGSMCAVGSECGYVTVFDTELLLTSEFAEDAIVIVVPSSRPHHRNGPGAIRAMMFSPQPWDLLLWSEDQGRVCVADLRTGLVERQQLELDPKAPGLDKVEIKEFDTTETESELQQLSREVDFIRRYRRNLDSDTQSSVNLTTEYLEAAMERRRNRHPHVIESDNDPHGLTPHERQVLDSLRTTTEALRSARDRLVSISSDAERLIVTIPRSINYSPTGFTVNESQSTGTHSTTTNAADSIPRRSYGSSNQTDSSQPPSLGPSITSLRDFLRERPLARSIPSLPPTFHAQNSTETAEALTGTSRAGDGDSWIHAPFPDPSTPSTTTPRSETRSDSNEMRRLRSLARARERIRSVREAQIQPLSTYDIEIMRRTRRLHFDPNAGVRTTGLAMSKDGRKLFVGTEDGIFVYRINVTARKSMPAIEPR